MEAQLRLELLNRESVEDEKCDDIWATVADQCRLSAEVAVVIDRCMREIAERKDDPRESLRQLLVLYQLFGKQNSCVVTDAVHYVEAYIIRLVKEEPTRLRPHVLPSVYEIRHQFSKKRSTYLFWPLVNYCKCEFFQQSGL